MKKLLITGCSYAYGHGLELFHPDINGKDWEGRAQQWESLPEIYKQFIFANRWPKLLADKLGLEEYNVSRPGNSNLSSLIFLKNAINKIGLENIDRIIFQTSHAVRAGVLPGETEQILTGYELAEYLEKYLNETGWKNLRTDQNILNFINSEEINLERNRVCIEDLTKMFEELKTQGINCHILEWQPHTEAGFSANPFRLNLFGTGETVENWADKNRLKGGNWMEDNGHTMYFWEGHLSLEGNKALTEEIYKIIS